MQLDFYFDQYFLCAACLNYPQASPTMHELSKLKKFGQYSIVHYSILFLLCGVFCIAIFLRSSFELTVALLHKFCRKVNLYPNDIALLLSCWFPIDCAFIHHFRVSANLRLKASLSIKFLFWKLVVLSI